MCDKLPYLFFFRGRRVGKVVERRTQGCSYFFICNGKLSQYLTLLAGENNNSLIVEMNIKEGHQLTIKECISWK